MAENTYRSNTFRKHEKERRGRGSKALNKFGLGFLTDPRFKLTLGFFLIMTSLYLLVAFISYLFTGKADQSIIESLSGTGIMESGSETENWLGLYGAITSHYIVFRWMGISAFFIPPLLFGLGFRLVFRRDLLPLFPLFTFSVFAGLWLSLLLGYMTDRKSVV